MSGDESSLLLAVADPQVTSFDPNERKLARQLRISKRKEAARRATHDGDGLHVEVYNKTEVERQVEESAEQLERLLLDGRELLTNVRVASDTREVNRRREEAENLKKRLQRFEDEENATKQMFEAISQKWEMMSKENDPMDLKAAIDAQKEKCNELLAQKNAVIKDLMEELEAADERFIKDQQRQMKEVSLLVQRIENQVKIMQGAYRRELQLIEDAINNERRELLESCNKHWETLYRQRDKEEVNMLSMRFQEQEDQENEVQRIRMEHQEKYRQTKIKLDTDIQIMHHELEQVKAMCLLNSEKLNYNYQVLQKREDENLMMRAQQKRRINKLQDIANNIRKKMRESEAAADNETTKLHDEISRLHQNILDIEKKSNHFAEVNDRRYHQVWELHQDTANQLVSKIMSIDRLIHEQQLGLEWTPPENVLIDKEDLPSYQSALKLVNQMFESKGSLKARPSGDESEDALSPDDPPSSYHAEGASTGYKSSHETSLKASRLRLLKLVLQRVADSAGFLVEDQLTELLAPYSKQQQTIIRLDNVFNALGLRHEADIEMLRDFFLPYAVCTICNKLPNDEERPSAPSIPTGGDVESLQTLRIFAPEQSSDNSGTPGENQDTSSSDHDAVSSDARTSDQASREQALSFSRGSSLRSTAPAPALSPQPAPRPPPLDKTCCEQHPLEIDPVYVLQALRSFVSKFQQNELSDLKSIAFLLSQKRNTISRLVSVEDVTKFWERYQRVFPKKRERLWEGILIALNKYHGVLCERYKLQKEVKTLTKQNAELRRLLEGYLDSNDWDDGKTFAGQKDLLPPVNLRKSMGRTA